MEDEFAKLPMVGFNQEGKGMIRVIVMGGVLIVNLLLHLWLINDMM